MANTVTTFLNERRMEIEGQIDLSAAAAVSAGRGTGMTFTKTAAGTYTAVIAGAFFAGKLVEILDSSANFSGTVPATALGVRVSSITQDANTDAVTITLKTSAQATTGADTDTTAATTISFRCVLRVGKMGAWT